MNPCIICDNNFNKSKHALVSCPYCTFAACRICCETYCLDKTVAACMNPSCGKEWSRKHIGFAFTKTFVAGSWKRNREKVLFEKERALLPATQAVIEDRIAKKNEKLRISVLIGENDALIFEHTRKRRELVTLLENVDTDHVSERKKFVRACPEDNCRGFLSAAWKCGLCEKWTCPDCHLVKVGEHVCNADDLATAKLLDSDTKTCPKCATGIFKIEGCDQMWCTQCHTAFSWRTGRIENKIHNPHFYEWQRRNGMEAPRVDGDIICGVEVNHQLPRQLRSTIPRIFTISYPEDMESILNEFDYLVETIIHLTENDLHQLRAYAVENNLNLRISYLMNYISEEDIKIRLQRNNKIFEKNVETCEVLELFVQTVTDVIQRLVVFVRDSSPNACRFDFMDFQDAFRRFMAEVEAIRVYSNECLSDIAKTYQHKAKELRLLSPYTRRHVLIHVGPEIPEVT